MMSEPRIRIGDCVLNSAQAMAVRVAITAYHAEVSDEEYKRDLGPIAGLYQAHLSEVLRIIFKSVRGQQ